MRAPVSEGVSRRVSWLELGACVAWGGATMVSALGMAIPYADMADADAPPAPPPIEAIDVALYKASTPRQAEPPRAAVSPEIPAAPDAPEPIERAQLKPLPPVTRPTVEVATPRQAPSTRSEIASRPTESSAPAASSSTVEDKSGSVGSSDGAVEELTFGVGQGRQPAPAYPRAAAREGQEGAVTVTFSVDVAGRTRAVEVTNPCPWPLLNHEAARVIRTRWRFPKGEPRRYRVTIKFRMAS